MRVKIDNLAKLKSFQILALRLPETVNVTLQQDGFTVNARRSLGILSLDLDCSMELVLYGADEEMIGYFEGFACECE